MRIVGCILVLFVSVATLSFKMAGKAAYVEAYFQNISEIRQKQSELLELLQHTELQNSAQRSHFVSALHQLRLKLKAQDFWFRYLEPNAYRKLNGPLPVEWETEVFEKYEPPYRREGAGLSLIEIALDEPALSKEYISKNIYAFIGSLDVFAADSVVQRMKDPSAFYFANRLFLLNLAAIYTTGFECPDTGRIVPELRQMIMDVETLYRQYEQSPGAYRLYPTYWEQYRSAIAFLSSQSDTYAHFDHFSWIRDHVNPLFRINQQMIREHGLFSRSWMDYTLNDSCGSIFDKQLFSGQQWKGLYGMVEDEATLKEIRAIGKLLFYDPILSANNKRSCSSCHLPGMYFSDSTVRTALQLDSINRLPRNTISLVNVVFNHLLMNDGLHTELLQQGKGVIGNPLEMGSRENEVLSKVLSCPDYRKAFQRWMRYTPGEKIVTMEHIVSALSIYYSSFSFATAPFDEAMHHRSLLPNSAVKGFNLFMGKAQCATCHFVPVFNGVKPPYVSSEFEVIGVPEDSFYVRVSKDEGRYNVHPVTEMMHAFRTSTVRNSSHTAPYMHNGVFSSLHQVMEFYNKGGAQGRGLKLPNQTLSSDPLGLTTEEIEQLVAFLRTLDESIEQETAPDALPRSGEQILNTRKIGGVY